MTLRDIMKEKAAEQRSKIVAEAQASTPVAPVVPDNNNVVTGMQGAAGIDAGTHVDIPPIKDQELDAALAKKALGVFDSGSLNKMFRNDGSHLAPIKGYFYPETEEDLKELQYFERQSKVFSVKNDRKKSDE